MRQVDFHFHIITTLTHCEIFCLKISNCNFSLLKFSSSLAQVRLTYALSILHNDLMSEWLDLYLYKSKRVCQRALSQVNIKLEYFNLLLWVWNPITSPQDPSSFPWGPSLISRLILTKWKEKMVPAKNSHMPGTLTSSGNTSRSYKINKLVMMLFDYRDNVTMPW
jgi:hypothetical protein